MVRRLLAGVLVFLSLSVAADVLDPYSDAVMPAGPFKGQRLDTSIRRSILMARTEPGTIGFYNFFHEGKFWYASVPEDAVEDVIFQVEYFPAIVPAAHTQLRFRLKEGKELTLIPQATADLPKVAKIRDVIFSGEATFVAGSNQQYDLVKGLFNHFALSLRVMSLSAKAAQMVTERKHTVRQILVKLTEPEKQRVFRDALKRSHAAGMNRMYNTLAKSCTTEVFDLLDDNVHYKLFNQIFAFLDRIPTNAYLYLKLRGLTYPNGASKLPTLNDEMRGVKPMSLAERMKNPLPCGRQLAD